LNNITLKEIQLSPGAYSQEYGNRVDWKMDRLRVLEKTRAFKRKRRDRHNKRATKVRQLEVREGTQ